MSKKKAVLVYSTDVKFGIKINETKGMDYSKYEINVPEGSYIMQLKVKR